MTINLGAKGLSQLLEKSNKLMVLVEGGNTLFNLPLQSVQISRNSV